MDRRVAVVGGGAVGTTAAFDLAARGVEVVLYERDELGGGASGRAAGIAYDAFAEDVDARVATRACERFRALASEGAIEFTDHPYVWLARAGDDRRAAAIRDQIEGMQRNDCDVELLDPPDVRERFPELDLDVEVAGVAHDAGYLDPGSYVEAMADRAREAGAHLETGSRVWLGPDGQLEAPAGPEPFDAVLVAAGPYTPRLLADAGIDVPVKPYRVQALSTAHTDVTPPMTYDATGGYYLRPRDGGLLVGDGTEEREFDPDDYDPTGDDWFVDASRERVRDALGVDPEVTDAWAGLCTATPDRDPLLGEVRPGLYVATGWHGHGFMRAPATGEAIAGQIMGGDPIAAFDPSRFDGGEEFDVVEGMLVEE